MADASKPTRGGAFPAVAAASGETAKKRRRDISGLKHFKEYMYGRGIPTLHAMILRNPTLMYPPAGVDEAREYIKLTQALHGHTQGDSPAPFRLDADGREQNTPQKRAAPATVDVNAFLKDLEGNNLPLSNNDSDLLQTPREGSPAPQDRRALFPASSKEAFKQDADMIALATYHRKQLGALVALFYDFNHTEFVKLPIKQTLNLLQRCGREAFAHETEFEETQRALKQRVVEVRRVETQHQGELERLAREGRESYFDTQLALAEAKATQLQQETGGGDEEEEVEEGLLQQHYIPNDQTLYTMFPMDDDDDDDIGDGGGGGGAAAGAQ